MAKKSFQLKLASKAYSAKFKKANPGPAYAWPMGLWFSVFFLITLIIIVCYSFMKRDVYGGVVNEFSLKAYKQMFDKSYMIIFMRTLLISFISTAITIMIALPCGYSMAKDTKLCVLKKFTNKKRSRSSACVMY